jgi:hypothetical protein
MPTVAVVDGVKIQFYYDEHPPAHFHVEFAEYQAMISIETLELMEGNLPRRQLRKIVAWAEPRMALLHDAWLACRSDENPGKIP